MIKYCDVKVFANKSKLCIWLSTKQSNLWSSRQPLSNLERRFTVKDALVWLTGHYAGLDNRPACFISWENNFKLWNLCCCSGFGITFKCIHTMSCVSLNPSSDNLYQLECMGWNPVNSLASTMKRYASLMCSHYDALLLWIVHSYTSMCSIYINSLGIFAHSKAFLNSANDIGRESLDGDRLQI